MSELYWINTQVKPNFFNFNHSASNFKEEMELHKNFINQVRREYLSFDFPYLALFPNYQYYLAQGMPVFIFHGEYNSFKDLPGLVKKLLEDGAFSGNKVQASLLKINRKTEEYIWKNQPLSIHQGNGITAIVEFSPIELYPEIISNLEQIYSIKRIKI